MFDSLVSFRRREAYPVLESGDLAFDTENKDIRMATKIVCLLNQKPGSIEKKTWKA